MGESIEQRMKLYPANAVIAEEGSPGVGWYILLSGRVGVFKHGKPIAEFNTRGIVFGEISSILARPRTARLTALEPTWVLQFEANLDELIAKYPNVARTVMISLAQRLEKTTDALWAALQPGDTARLPVPPSSD